MIEDVPRMLLFGSQKTNVRETFCVCRACCTLDLVNRAIIN